MKDRIFAALNLDEKEMSLYNSIANILEKNIVYPDLVIFLQSETSRLMNNIKLHWQVIIAMVLGLIIGLIFQNIYALNCLVSTSLPFKR